MPCKEKGKYDAYIKETAINRNRPSQGMKDVDGIHVTYPKTYRDV